MEERYKIIEAKSAFELEQEVNNFISENPEWHFLGGAVCSLSENDNYRYELWSQTLIF